MKIDCPRLVIAGLSGDSGKTLVSLSLLVAWRHRGMQPTVFKKGPDYIDAAWLSWAAGRPCRNVDTFLQQPEVIRRMVGRYASPEVNLIEGNRGLFDGVDLEGTHSTAALAKLLQTPVVLVVEARKVTRTVAALVLGCRQFDPEVTIAGAILNQISSARHERIVRRAVEELAHTEVIGVLPRINSDLLPDRHLGLVPPQEHAKVEALEAKILQLARDHIELDRLLALAAATPPLAKVAVEAQARPQPTVRIGIFSDSAFTFYYPDNLEALEAAGAELVFISGLNDSELPRVDGLYLGGGFPETHVYQLARNCRLHRNLRNAAFAGMPIYAECGGLVFLARSLTCGGRTYPMCGVLPVDIKLYERPQGHGYVELIVDQPNPIFQCGTRLSGHEFHYTRIQGDGTELPTAYRVTRGTGSFKGRDGLIFKNVLAGYSHLHALGVPQWAPGLVRCAAAFRQEGVAPDQ